MQPVRTNHIADSADFSRVFGVSRETLGRLQVYERLLRTWQKTINLVAPSTLDEVWHRHFADSAQLVPIAAECLGDIGQRPVRWMDLGSGGGFPGLVVGILWVERGPMRLTLVDSDQRKAAFLREVVRETGLKAHITVDIVPGRIETGPNHSTNGGATSPVEADVVSARALAPLPKLLEWAAPYFGPAVGIFPKGRDAADEVKATEALGQGWSLALRQSLTDAEARIVVARRTG